MAQAQTASEAKSRVRRSDACQWGTLSLARYGWRTSKRWLGAILQIAIQRRAVEGHHDDLAAVGVVPLLLFLWHIQNGEGEMAYMTILQDDSRALDLLPVIHPAVGVA